MSSEDIRLVVKKIRQICGLNGRLKVPVCFLFELILEKIFQKFEREIVPDAEMSEEGKTFTGEKLKAFEDPEWQANTFAAEFLMDFDLIQGMDYKEISKSCGVTYGAAKTRIGKMPEEVKKSIEIDIESAERAV